jgi:hypothetical protein
MGTLRFCHQPAVKVNFPVPVSPTERRDKDGAPGSEEGRRERSAIYPATLEGKSFSREGENTMIVGSISIAAMAEAKRDRSMSYLLRSYTNIDA